MVEIMQRTIQSKDDELENKNRLINSLTKESLTSSMAKTSCAPILDSNSAVDLDTLDIEPLPMLDHELGDVDLDEILNVSGCSNILQTDFPNFDEDNDEPCKNEEEKDENLVTTEDHDQSIIKVLVEQNKNFASLKKHLEPAAEIVDKDVKTKRKFEEEAEPTKKKQKVESRSLHCPDCDKQFPLGGSWKLKKHMLTQHKEDEIKQTFPCNHCSKKFSSKAVMLSHSKRHKMESPFECSSCSYPCKDMVELVNHTKKNHPTTVESRQILFK